MAERAYASTVSGEDWALDDLSGRTFEDVLFRDSDFSETTSTHGAVFAECAFRAVRFNLAEHHGAAFTNCSFANCDFLNATFVQCKVVGSKFERCTFDRLTVRGGDWSFVGLAGADLRKASFEDARMREADLTGALCSGSRLRNLDLSGASFDRGEFDACDLRGSDLTSMDPWTVTLRRAIVDWQQAVTLASGMGLDVRPD